MNKTTSTGAKLPTPLEFYQEVGLYDPLLLSDLGIEGVLRIEFFQTPLESFCAECGRTSIFQSRAGKPRNAGSEVTVEWVLRSSSIYHGLGYMPVETYAFRTREFTTTFECSLDSEHKLSFWCRVGESYLQKIGQYPSLADIATGNLRNYRRVISKERAREFGKAVGLFAHGIGVGSFVYLRRVFENEIEQAHEIAKKDPKWNEGEFPNRMEEKILSLKSYLPEKLVKNRGIYSILSKGIHELGEDECKRYFPAVRAGIELILAEKLERIEHSERERDVENAISEITGELKST